MSRNWRSYEEVAAYLLDRNAQEFGLQRVEGKQAVGGCRSGGSWEIDAKGVQEGGEGFVIVECRRHTTSKQNQERLGALAYRILDTGAAGGIIVSPLGLQEGAARVAAAEHILDVQLDANSTPAEFAMRFLNRLILGVGCSAIAIVGTAASVQVLRNCEACGVRFTALENETSCPDCRAKQA